ncbi:MAG: hypothetical protein AVDCRST_MAG23-1402 [uncultured Sphingosinicella sp.]|uniref:PepSY domain-containing protein n=1 Tax=uncultured Sphingosinicella sp. TaxID=478748 RepID=A0A6J4TXC1_9SPHN|nr:hypothetical protein [uncultured Sphingosinicella sp.]CAA9534867.1 MAG: hypothetical protein AVDCRST_MAG23-1402 [uncultured Sphingosinicella sp.]
MAHSMRLGYAAPMFKRSLLALAAAGLLAAGPSADARPRGKEQATAFRETQEGRFLSLRNIESRILPRMRGSEYLGPELDPSSGRYRLKFMRNGQVTWIDVDARSGDVISQTR